MSDFSEFIETHQRLAILRHLSQASGGSANDSLLCGIMLDLGLGLSRSQLRTEIQWLAEQGLVTSRQPAEGVTVAQITERGIDVANGVSSVPGVQKPSPAARILRNAGGG